MRIFKILGIEPTKNEMEIKEAYLNKLSDTNPEDKPEEFMQLRKAYEEAIEYANQEEVDTNEKESQYHATLSIWGGRWDSNPRSSGPQSDALTS